MIITAKVFGVAKGKQQARKLLTQIESVGNKSMKEGADMLLKKSKSLIQNASGGGRKYSGLPNTSSRPGHVPVSQSGELVNSIRKNRIKPKRWAVWSNVVQAYWTIGLPHSPNMSSERPFFQIAADKVRVKVYNNTVENYRKLLK